MTHKMLLVTPDLKVKAKVEVKAGVAQVEEHPIRNRKAGISTIPVGTTIKEVLEYWSKFEELGKRVD